MISKLPRVARWAIGLVIGVTLVSWNVVQRQQNTHEQRMHDRVAELFSVQSYSDRRNLIRSFRSLSAEQQRAIVVVLAERPPIGDDWNDRNTQHQLVQAALSDAPSEVLDELEVRWAALGPPVQRMALRILATHKSEHAARLLVENFPEHAEDIVLPFKDLIREPRHGPVFLPLVRALLDSPRNSENALILLLGLLEAEELRAGDLSDFGPYIVHELRSQLALSLEQIPANPAPSWFYRTETYVGGLVGVLTDLSAYFADPAVNELLGQLRRHPDPRVAYFAVNASLRLDIKPEPEVLIEIAAAPDTRQWLFDLLKKEGRVDSFPTRYLNQAAFAEASVVDWLRFPTELGTVPDSIELMEVIRSSWQDIAAEVYLFRFREQEGTPWYAAVSGTYLSSETPTWNRRGSEFSRFEEWSSRSPEDHVAAIHANLTNWCREFAAERRAATQTLIELNSTTPSLTSNQQLPASS